MNLLLHFPTMLQSLPTCDFYDILEGICLKGRVKFYPMNFWFSLGFFFLLNFINSCVLFFRLFSFVIIVCMINIHMCLCVCVISGWENFVLASFVICYLKKNCKLIYIIGFCLIFPFG